MEWLDLQNLRTIQKISSSMYIKNTLNYWGLDIVAASLWAF